MGFFDVFNQKKHSADTIFGRVDVNNPLASEHGLGARVSDDGFLSNFRWYDGIGMAAAPFWYPAAIAARSGVEAAFQDAELPGDINQAVGGKAAPPPDFTDAMVQLAAKAERDRISSKQGRRSSFVTGQDASSTFLGSY